MTTDVFTRSTSDIFDGERRSTYVDDESFNRQNRQNEDEVQHIHPPPYDGPVPHVSEASAGATVDASYCSDPFPLSEYEVREALLGECRRHRLWKNATVNKMEILSIQSSAALHYVVDCYTETRSTISVSEPYGGQGQMNSGSSSVPQAWDIPCEPETFFVEETKVMEVPNSSKMFACPSCSGHGSGKCNFCRSTGFDYCHICNGTGMRSGIPHPNQTLASSNAPIRPFSGLGPRVSGSGGGALYGRPMAMYASPNPANPYCGVQGAAVGIPPHEWCYFCHGIGSKPCTKCNGSGKLTCRKCNGTTMLRTFTKMIVKYRTESQTFFYETSEIPSEKLQQVSGNVVLEDSHPRVLPLRNHPVAVINEQSKRLIADADQNCIGRCRILFQRQTLRVIPIHEVSYRLGGKERMFWIYGEERKVYIKKFPDRCCIL